MPTPFFNLNTEEHFMNGLDILTANFLSPIVLTFILGLIAGAIKSELELPEAVLKLISIYLLFSIGLKGGAELAAVNFSQISALFALTVGLIIAVPVVSYLVARKCVGLDRENSAALAAHYGSVSSVTFFASLTFGEAMKTPSDGYITAVVALLEWGVVVALIIARWTMGRAAGTLRIADVFIETLRGRGIVLLTGGMIIGALASEKAFKQITPFYDDLFRGILMLFLLEMGMTAARQIKAFKDVGIKMVAYGTLLPVCLGIIGVSLGYAIGLSLGTAFVLGAILASSSYIDAPATCRAALPNANPGIYLTTSLAVTFPFNLLIGLPLYYKYTVWLYS
jgi:uncharacterized protein